MRNRIARKRGFTLLASAVCTVALFAVAGLAVDIGRMYITKNEAQSYSDAGAVSAAMQLNGTADGLTRADAAVAASPNTWNFGTTTFSGTVVEYSTDGLTNWQTSAAANAATAAYARVTATVNNLPLYLLPVLNAFGGNIGNLTTVRAFAVAGQVLRAPTIFPYSPVAHQVNCGTPGLPAGMNLGTACDATGNFGYQIGQQYDLKWPQNAVVGVSGGAKVPCDGDNVQSEVNMFIGSPPFDGAISFTGTSSIVQQIQDDQRPYDPPLGIGSYLSPPSGEKNTVFSDFNDRAALDNLTSVVYQTPLSDVYGAGTSLASPDGKVDIHDNATYHAYETGSGFTGRRIITVIVRSAYADINGTPLPTAQQFIGVGFAQFLLWPSNYDGSGGSNTPWCGTYIGSDALYGVNHGGVGNGGVGVSYVRLTQ